MAFFAPCFNPLANIRRAILQLDSPSFTGCKKLYDSPIHEPNFLQVKSDDCDFCFRLEEFL